MGGHWMGTTTTSTLLVPIMALNNAIPTEQMKELRHRKLKGMPVSCTNRSQCLGFDAET